ncbi:hypothetical protein [Xanthomonas campestris]|uniref:hypothetical protein n=1 Tax=Xanthomonas campestris TaxID=339 RepID=UPI0013DE0B53|nr:hypothetical protein [Xanthomonas campestris]
MYDTAAIAMSAGPSHRQYTTTASHRDWPTISMMHQPATSAMVLDDATAFFWAYAAPTASQLHKRPEAMLRRRGMQVHAH